MAKQQQTETGGAAFPQFTTDAWENPVMHGGMTLRDYFAGQALSGLIAQCDMPNELYGRMSFSIADEMLKARDKQPTTNTESTNQP